MYIKKNKNWGEKTKFRNDYKQLYFVWRNMRTRCFNKNSADYKNYGGRGILIDKRWDIFKNFVDDMRDGYKKGLTLDRINNNFGYSKLNCKWSSRKEQNNNKRNLHRYFFDGFNMTIPEWAELTKIKESTLYQRLYIYKWPINKVLTKGASFGTN